MAPTAGVAIGSSPPRRPSRRSRARCGEEACARVVRSSYIGCQRVEELDGNRLAYYQTRFWARIELDEFRPEHEMTARQLVAPEQFRATLFWGAEPTAGLILERGLAIESGDRERRR
jgi:hypothetical protein